MIIHHLTDVEGNFRYFKKWVNRSPHLCFHKNQLGFTSSQPQQFVYGGDFCDKGPGDLRIGSLLYHFKKNYPEKVCLIAGNREIKYRRFAYELGGNIRDRLRKGPAPFWNPMAFPRVYLLHHLHQEGKKGLNEHQIQDYLNNKSDLECQTLYLKWMLNETMGCGSNHGKPPTFEYRRQELAEIQQRPVEQISDGEITQSFIDAISPDGIVTHYLKNTVLGKIWGETLFIHGAVTLDNMGSLPGQLSRCDNAKEWIEQLNEWYEQQIKDWLNNPYEDKLSPPGHKPLDHYVIGNPKSIVTSNWYTQGQIKPIPSEVIAFLNKAGIYRVVSGHQPFADFPLIIRSPNFEVIVGDTSYSDIQAKQDNRGQAIHNLSIRGKHKSKVLIDAIRKDGSAMCLELPPPQAFEENEFIIGQFTEDCRIIRPLTQHTLVSSQLAGFEVLDEPLHDLSLTDFKRNQNRPG